LIDRYFASGGRWDVNFCSPIDLLQILDADWISNDDPIKIKAREFVESDGINKPFKSTQSLKKGAKSRDYPGIVYVLKADNGLYKIGRTKKFKNRY